MGKLDCNNFFHWFLFPFAVKVNDTVIFGGEGDEDEILFDDYEDGGEEEADIDAVSY